MKRAHKKLQERWRRDVDFVWSEPTSQFAHEGELREFLGNFFMEHVEIDFDFTQFSHIIIDTENKEVAPLE